MIMKTAILGLILATLATPVLASGSHAGGHGEAMAVGEPIFVDNGTHVMRIRCQAPRTVLVGATVYRLHDPPVMGDWKEDLWKALCLQPVS
jgi:hypothetical protein